MTTARYRHIAPRKIVDLNQLLSHRAAARASGKTVVHCHGCFDIVHPGHIRYFQFAKQQGDILVVSLTGDPHVGKGEGRPYVPQELRAENLAALEMVDYVYINPTNTAVDLLANFKPDIYIKGREYEHNNHPGFLKEKHTVEAYGGRVIFSSGDVVYSSSHIIDNYAHGGGRLDLEQEKIALFCKRYNVRKHTLIDIMDNIVDRPFIIVGDLVLDRYQYCDASDIAGDGPNMSLVPLERRDYLGGAAMIARHLAGLGAEPTLLTSLGTDDASDAAIDDLEAAGVHVLPIRNRKKIATKTRFVVDTQKLFTLDECPATPTDSTNERYVLDQLKKLAALRGPDTGNSTADDQNTLILYDAGVGMLTDSLTLAILHQSRTKADESGGGRFHRICAGTASSRGRLVRFHDIDLLVGTERALRIAMRDHEQGVSSLAYRLLDDLRTKALLTPLGKKGLLAFDSLQHPLPGESWEGKLRSEYLASPVNGTIDKLGTEEALLAIAAGMLGGGANLHQAAYVALTASILEARQLGHLPLDGHELRQHLEARPELAE
ncbi:MAG TPA: adenylyltransferase/cytidyltransferase family protein [Phycisphaerae bacterium]|nr:adenylyltransferase/cytidyltransferase family protein [Phycisphaerae bacterium]